MLLTRSLYNPALLRSDLRRCWPLLGGYTLLWLLFLPMNLWRNLTETAPEFFGQTIEHILSSALAISVWFNLLAGIVLAAALFSYLSSTRATYGLHSFPLSRSCQYRTHVLCGVGGVLCGDVVVFLLTVLAQAGKGVLWGESLTWLLSTVVMFLLFFALGVLCCTLTGWLPAALVAYAGANCVAVLARLLMSALCDIFYPSYNGSLLDLSGNDIVTWLTPVMRLNRSFGGGTIIYRTSNVNDTFVSTEAWVTMLVYGLVAVGLLATSCVLCRIRRSERSGDTLAFKPLQPVVRWLVGLLGGLGLGLFFAMLFGHTNALGTLLACTVLLGLVCMTGSQMLIAKTPRVFKKIWPELIILCVIITGILLSMKADVFGYESRIPKADQVQTVRIYTNSQTGDCVTGDPSEIAAVIEAHKYFQSRTDNADGFIGRPITFSYVMEDGRVFTRRYDLRSDDQKNILPMLETDSFRRSMVMDENSGLTLSDIQAGYYDLGKGGIKQDMLSQEQCRALYEAILEDAAAMDMSAVDLYEQERCNLAIHLQNFQGNVFADLFLNTQCTRTLQLLQDWDIIENAEEIFNQTYEESADNVGIVAYE